MEKITGAERDRLNKLGREYLSEWREEREKALEKLSPELREFVNYCCKASVSPVLPALADDLINGLEDGRYKKPSDFFNYKAMALFNGVIYPGRQKDFLYAVDHVHERAYSTSLWRRSFRSKEPAAVAQRVMQIVYDYYERDHFDADICDILEEKNLSEKQLGHLRYSYYNKYGLESIIAAEIDFGNERLINIVKDALCGDSEASVRLALSGAMQSHNKELHELVGKLLLAAQLQEGLRQAICQEMDCAVPEVFTLLLDIIIQNNLIRFSSVKRAVGTWLGLINTETDKVERISEKSVELIADCINAPSVREEYLASEDSMKIYVALWSYGFYEAYDMMKKIEELSLKGTHHQVLTAGYAAINLDNKFFMHEIAKIVVKQHKNEQDILAMYMPCLMSDFSRRIENALTGRPVDGWDNNRYYDDFTTRKYCDYSCYFEDREEAEEYFDTLSEIMDGIKGKSLEFSPCVFPWHSAVLSKSDIIGRLAFIASSLQDNDKIDKIASRIPEIETGYSGYTNRARIVKLLLTQPETDFQRKLLAEAVCDKETYARKAAFEIIQKTEITPENYLRLEDMLKYKNAEMRSNLITLLMEQTDEALFGTVDRLVSDKKEEKRTAGLDIIIQLSKDEKRKSLSEKCSPLALKIEKPTTKEKILIGNITGSSKSEEAVTEVLYTDEDEYRPELPENDYMLECVDLFMEYFPDSQLGAVLNPKKYSSVSSKVKGIAKKISGDDCEAFKQAREDIISLSECIKANRDREFIYNGEAHTFDCYSYEFHVTDENGNQTVPFMEEWQNWFDERKMDTARFIRMLVATAGYTDSNEFTKSSEKYISALFGKGFEKYVELDYSAHLGSIISELKNKNLPLEKWSETRRRLAFAAVMWFMKAVPDSDVMFTYTRSSSGYKDSAHLLGHTKINEITGHLDSYGEYLEYHIALGYLAIKKCYNIPQNERKGLYPGSLYSPYYNHRGSISTFHAPDNTDFINAAYLGKISERTMYWFILGENDLRGGNLKDALNTLSNITSVYREQGRQVSAGREDSIWKIRHAKNQVSFFIGRQGKNDDAPFTEEEKKKLAFAAGVYDKILGIVLNAELNRGDSETPYSYAISSINRIYGERNFVAILSALGKDTLERGYSSGNSKRSSLSHLLGVCIPEPEDNADSLRELVKDTDITEKRLIEAALYSPEWIDIVGEYLGWEGFTSACYYFMAHMNERFDDKRKAVIARYTPLDEEELNSGAFDIDWFRSAYDTVGEKRFNMIYDAAKYISDGAKHSRARKYADAVQGKMAAPETVKTIADKRNKDLLMAYALIPLADDDDLSERYLYLQQFLKESKKFGSQRSASEKKAVETAMRNLALNAGYSDTARLTLRMETKLIDDSRELFEDKQIEDVIVKLVTDENGKTEILCNKNGKALKSVPAKLKKNEYIVRLSETKKALTEQYRRTKAMFEQAMEDGTEFTAGEINILRKNPVILPVINDLIFASGGKIGFFKDGTLTDYAGKVTKLTDSDKLSAAHTFLICKDGHWQDYQKLLFDKGTVQPFKQVFRELYIKTDEEREMNHSLRYAGNQIQPAKTVACLKSRRWVADVEDGLQKVYYKENIVARIYAIADWFTPADIEAPTLEWVEFSDRKTGKEIKIGDVPDIIFSEVMRDVDLAVSVAHAGGVDPEASHSTMEMRAALMEFTLPLFKLGNVQIKEHHAHIEGKYGDYTVHLGSGVIHKKGGAMIAVLPVHSQHRGKLFLPFADDDPKTAEIITKVLFLAEDSKIKDPTILEQIKA
ncbi:MAG: DUF4132 domain-containing protein [Oscillospiraceae bacterium]|nr:DUF4132 domain-containing protein [Oscillospiraceae bacterium]